jgi:hypothetical protein
MFADTGGRPCRLDNGCLMLRFEFSDWHEERIDTGRYIPASGAYRHPDFKTGVANVT